MQSGFHHKSNSKFKCHKYEREKTLVYLDEKVYDDDYEGRSPVAYE